VNGIVGGNCTISSADRHLCFGGPAQSTNLMTPRHLTEQWTYDNTNDRIWIPSGVAQGTVDGGTGNGNSPYCGDCDAPDLYYFTRTGSNIDPVEACGPQVKCFGSVPSARTWGGVVWDDCNNQLIEVQGNAAGFVPNDTSEFNPTTKTWTQQTNSFTVGRYRGMAFWNHSQCSVYYFYGLLNDRQQSSEIWKGVASPGNIAWTNLSVNGPAPPPNVDPVMDVDPRDGTIGTILYVTQDSPAQVWEFDPAVYTAGSSGTPWKNLNVPYGPLLKTPWPYCAPGTCDNLGAFNAATNTFDLIMVNTAIVPIASVWTLNMSGSGTHHGPSAWLNSSGITFNNQKVKTASAMQTVTLTNNGTTTLAISGISIKGNNAADFTQTNNCPAILAVNSNCVINMVFTPLTPGSENTSLLISDNATGSPQVLELLGTGTAGNTAGVSVSPSGVSFYGQSLGTTSPAQSIIVTNTGSSSLTVSGITISGINSADFVQTNNCSSTLATGSNCTVNITFTPSTAETESASLIISDNAPGSPQSASLSGSGTSGGGGTSGAVNVPLTIQEAIYSGVSGISRTQDPITVGIPLPDSANINSTTQLGLSGTLVGQFRALGRWPSGNIKWLLVDSQTDLPAGGQNTNIALTQGTGNFGGNNLATDNGTSITVNTGTAMFTIKKANFNLIDQAVVNGQTLVASGSSAGLVVTGPAPGSTTCPCTTTYSSSNDPNSTAVIEENGPVRVVIKATGQHKDASGNAYMRYTVRLHFYKSRSNVKVVSQLQNADYGAPNTFTSAYKGFSSYEARLTPTLGNGRSFSFGSSGSPVNGSFTGNENAYLYQAYSNELEDCGWNSPDKRPQYALRSYIARSYVSGTSCQTVWKYAQEGYEIVHGSASIASGTRSQYPAGWADLQDSTGAGLEIGVYQMAAYWPKSLQFMNGGTEARIGIWPDQTLFQAGGGQQYIQSWPQYSVHTLYLNFHSSALSNASAEFPAFQYNLIARAPGTQYSTSGVLPFALEDPAEEDSYYKSLGMWCCVKDYNNPSVFRNYSWATGGGGNQSEFRWADLMLWLQRGHVGRYLNSSDFYRFQTEQVFPRSDFNGTTPFHWRDASIPASNLDGSGVPAMASLNNNIGCDPGETQCGRNWIDDQHAHWYGMIDYYFMTGDESINDAIQAGASDKFGNPNTQYVQKGLYWASRNIGEALMSDARLNLFYNAIGNSVSASNAFAAGDLILQNQVWPNMQLSGFGTAPQGVSRVRGAAWGCCDTPQEAKPFQMGILNEGLWEYLQAHGKTWPQYQQTFDLAYGIANFTLTEAWRSGTYVNNCDGGTGMAYDIYLDVTNNPLPAGCNQTVWFNFFIPAKYTGDPNASDGWASKFATQLQRINTTPFADYGTIFIGATIHEILHPETYKLVDVPATNSGGTLSWTVPIGAVSYRVKYSSGNIVDTLNFNPVTNTFGLDPNANTLWFAATDVPGFPSPTAAGATQTYGLRGLGSTANLHFDLKAYISASGGSTGGPITVGIVAPAQGATVSNNIPVSANASSSAGVAGVQFKLDGANLGTESTMSPYSVKWDTTTSTNGLHTLTATVFDLAGNQAAANPVTVTVLNANNHPATVSITSPPSGATLSRTVSVSANASSSLGIAGVQFSLDGGNFGAEVVNPPYSIVWDTTKTSNGRHSLSAAAFDTSGTRGISSTVTVTVANVNSAQPSVSIASPTAGAVVSGKINIAAATSGFSGVPQVQFTLDGAALGFGLLRAPYISSWDTTIASNGSHILQAIASDTAGNSSSASVRIEVNNSSVGAPPPPAGSKVVVAIDGLTQFTVQSDDLAAAVSDCSNCRFQSQSDLLAGQTTVVRLRSGSSPPVADQVVLQQGALNGTIAGVENDQFVMRLSGTPGPTSVLVTLTPGVTGYERFPSASPSLKIGQTVAVRGLLFKSGPQGGAMLIAKIVALAP
jgi:Big-like domain-containing protein/exo-rhamnogalacturonan lyase-like protein/centrosomal CEP192-like protein